MRIAVIGSGRIGALHARTLVDLTSVDEVIVTDTDKGRASALARELGCLAFDPVEAVWAQALDGVVITSSTRTHPALVHAALDARVGVLCEKPLTLSLRESIEIASRAGELGVPVMVGFQRRFDRSFRTLRDEVADGRYGTTFVLRMEHSDTAPPPPGYLATAPGTMFVDMCIHDYDAARWLVGCEVEAVSSAGARLTGLPEFERHDDVDSVVSVLHFESGTIGVLEAFRQSPHGYCATAEVVAADRAGERTLQEPRVASWLERFADAFREEVRAFVASLTGVDGGGGTTEDATKALQLALAGEIAFRERRLVPVAEVS